MGSLLSKVWRSEPRRLGGTNLPDRPAAPIWRSNFFSQPKSALYAMRRPPNILITGTPGTGKSSLAESLQHNFDGLTHLNISEIIKERKLGESHNSEWDTWEFDDDKVPSRLEKKVTDFRFWIVLRERR